MELVEMHKIQVSGHISSGGSRGRARVPRLFLDQTEAESMDPPLWSKPRYIATFFKAG